MFMSNRTLDWNIAIAEALTGHYSLKQLKEGLFRFDSKGKKPISCKKYAGKEISHIIAVIVVASIRYSCIITILFN